MSIPINTDNSVQLSYSSFPFAISDIDNYATSNFVSNVSNALRTAINTKQDTLTAATNLLGVGTSITAIDYNKVSVNKPTNFQADWNSTIINKPNIYTQSQIDTFLNAKQNNLTAATTLLGTGGSITGINYNTVINKPSYSLPLNSNATTNTISISLSDYYNQTQVNTAITNTSNYASNISNILKANIDTKQNTLTASTVLSGIGSNLKLVNYNTLSNLPDLTVYNGWTKTGNNVYNTITGGNVGVGLNTNITHKLTVNGLSSTNGMLVGFVNTSNFYPNEPGSYIVLRHNTFSGLIGANNPKPECAFIMANNTSAGNLNWSFYSGVVKYAATTSPNTSLRYDIGSGLIPNTLQTLTGTNTFNPLMSFLYTGNIGIGSISPVYKLDINGSLNSTSLYQNGVQIDFSSYATKNTDIINTSNYASNISNILKTNIDANNTTINTAITNTSNYALNISNILKTNIDANNTTINTAITNTSNYALNISNILKTNIDAKDAILSFTSPLIRTVNTITFNESSITTLTNFYNKTEANARYLQLDGTNIMTGGLRFNNILANKVISLYDATPTANNHQFVGFGANNGLVLNTFATTDAFQFRVGATTTTSTELMRLTGTGNLAIGTTPFSVNTKLTITGTSTGYSQPLVRIQQLAGWDGNYCLQTVGYSDFGGIRINGADTGNSIFKTAATGDLGLTVNNGNMLFNANGAERMRIDSSGNTTIKGALKLKNDTWHTSIEGVYRTYYATNEISYYCCGGNSAEGHIFMNNGYSHVFKIKNNGDISCTGALTTGGIIKSTSGISEFNYVWIHNPGRNDTHLPYTNGENYIRGKLNIDQDGLYVSGNVGIGTQPTLQKLEVNGPTNITGSLSVQSADLHTFKSPGGLGGNFNCAGNITCLLYSITNSGTDYVGVGNASSGNNQNYLRQLYIMFETFTGFHRCFTNDELFDNENPQNFKDTYIGRIVVSTGKIATDFKSIDNDDWEIKYDKEGITIEDALPMIELSRKKKDKRVFGILGNSKRNNSRSERLIINSVGEGAIWVCNSNGNIENGDYIQSSDHLGYGEKQDDDLLHNYTVAKATMDCDFELDNPLYNCFELDDGLRVAFVAATYHCG
jgi:hypothetical protein